MYDFPNSPVLNQITYSPQGTAFVWDGVKWNQGAVPQEYVPMAGGTMVGPLILSQDPTVPLGAASKRYVDNATAAGVASFNTRTGPVTLTTADISGANGLTLAGGVLTGSLTLANNATQPMQAAAFGQIPQVSTTTPVMDGTAAIGSDRTHFAAANHVHPTDTSRAAQASLANYLPLSGGTMSGPLQVNSTIVATNVIQSGTGQGYVQLTPGGSTHTGFVGFFNSAGTRQGYIGFNDGTSLMINVDSTTQVYVTGAFAVTGSGSFGGTLGVAGATTSNGPILCNGGGRIVSYGSSNPSLCAWNSAGYASVFFCDASGTIGLGDSDGSGNAQNYRLSIDRSSNVSIGGQFTCGQNLIISGAAGIQYAHFGGHWFAFGWNGNINCYVDGGYQFDIASTGWVQSWAKPSSAYTPNQNVDSGANVNFYQMTCNILGTTSVFPNHSWGFWQSGNNAYMRLDGTWDYYAPYSGSSDARLKRDIGPTEIDALDILNKFELVKFNWRDDMRTVPKGGEPIGFTTQQLKEAFSAAVNPVPEDIPPYVDAEGNPTNGVFHESINTNVMLALLVGAVQQLADRLSKAGL